MLGGVVTIDLHGKNVHQATVAVDAALRRAGLAVYRLRLVHGHHGGTALRDMIEQRYGRHAGVLRLCRINEGTTDLVLREF